MLHKNLTNPNSIVVVGASNSIETPGGKVLYNLLNHNFSRTVFGVNPKETNVQGVKCYKSIHEIPNVELAIIAISAKFILETVQVLTRKKNTKGFIIFSAGFSELNEEGKKLETEITREIDAVGGTLLGPNNIGLINQHYTGVFTTPIPKLNPKGADFISGSGATAVFIMEAAKANGLAFSSVYTVGNSPQTGIEEILEHLDETFNPLTSSKVKLLYIESIKKPQKLLKHALSLHKKGCKIAAIKAGSSAEGSLAASSHTGAMANSDTAVNALFNKAGIVRCYGRNELVNVATVFMHQELKGNNIGIITHAGGPAVMLTDILSENNLKIPRLTSQKSQELLQKLYPGSTVNNPIDFLATGNAQQLETIIDYCENEFNEIDAMVIIFGSPGLFKVFDVYDVIHQKKLTCKKPIFTILPSVENVKNEINYFISKGNYCFPDEVLFGKALGKVINTPKPAVLPSEKTIKKSTLHQIIKHEKKGYLKPKVVQQLLKEFDIPFVEEVECSTFKDCLKAFQTMNFPLVMKVVGPVHKSDIGGVILNITSQTEFKKAFSKLMKIPNATSVLIQPMKKGMELFIGVKKENEFGHLILCGLGGIYVEVLKDTQVVLAPVSKKETEEMVQKLRAYPVLKGIRNQEGIAVELFSEIIKKVSDLVCALPEICEMDINPLIATKNEIIAVDARIKIERLLK